MIIDFAPSGCSLGLAKSPNTKPTLVHHSESNFSPHVDFPHTWEVCKRNPRHQGWYIHPQEPTMSLQWKNWLHIGHGLNVGCVVGVKWCGMGFGVETMTLLSWSFS
jgi:hypothetical protein